MTERKQYAWKGDDHPPGWKRVGSIDVADPANTRWARDQDYRVGTIYDGGSDSAVEPCFADVYESVDQEDDASGPAPKTLGDAVREARGGDAPPPPMKGYA